MWREAVQHTPLMPAKAGIQLGPRFRGDERQNSVIELAKARISAPSPPQMLHIFHS